MKQALTLPLFTLTLLFLGIDAQAESRYLKLIKNGEVQYESKTCSTFLQSFDSSTFKATKIKEKILPLSELNKGNTDFFHYSDDPGGHLKNAVDRNDFSPVVDYLLTYASGLGNVRGAGMYVAANPFSSASYGSYQVSLNLDSATKVFKYDENVDLVRSHIASLGWIPCQPDTMINLVLAENDVDLIQYSPAQEWSVLLNSLMILESEFHLIGATDQYNVIQKMISAGIEVKLLGLLPENKRIFQVSLETILGDDFKGLTSNGIIDKVLADSKKMPDENKLVLVKKLVIRLSGDELKKSLHELMEKFPAFDITRVSLEGASKDFTRLLSEEVSRDPSIVQKWDDSTFAANMRALTRHDLLTKEKAFDWVVKQGQLTAYLTVQGNDFQSIQTLVSKLDKDDPRRQLIDNHILGSANLSLVELTALYSTSIEDLLKKILASKDSQSIAGFTSKVSNHFGAGAMTFAYAKTFVDEYENVKNIPGAQDHMVNFFCKRINKRYIINDLIDSMANRQEKKHYRELRNAYCPLESTLNYR